VAGEAVPDAALPVEIRGIQPGDVGIRTPAHAALQELLGALGELAWATSVNTRGDAPAATAGELERWLATLTRPPELVVTSAPSGAFI
jgi:tRNA A37 threonylcarbamoyladenosine synthetase subunit TsaC/SUA5/YrdC